MEDSKVMLQFRHAGQTPSLEQVCRLFDLETAEVDPDFGVIATDPSDNLYTVLIDERSVRRVQSALASRQSDPAEGVFANPKIEPFGPPEE